MQLTCTTLTQLTCNSAAALSRHRITVASPASSPGRHTHALFFACVLFFVAIVSHSALVSPLSV